MGQVGTASGSAANRVIGPIAGVVALQIVSATLFWAGQSTVGIAVAAAGVALMGTTFLGARRTVEQLSHSILELSLDQVELQLVRFFEPFAISKLDEVDLTDLFHSLVAGISLSPGIVDVIVRAGLFQFLLPW